MALQRVEFEAKDGTTCAVEWWYEKAGLCFYVTEREVLADGQWRFGGPRWKFVLGYKAGTIRLPCPRCGDDHPWSESCPDIFAR